jgi:uncharacterized protein YigE (DUF2233 family)
VVALTKAGIFEPGFVPTQFYVEDGVEHRPFNGGEGWGHFYLRPNGAFLVDTSGRARVVATSAWESLDGEVAFATQSGPLLLDGGHQHPRFREGSPSYRLRSGVGVRPDGSAVLAVSTGAVNFRDFAVLFRDGRGAPDARYLDGSISRMTVPTKGRSEEGQFAAVIAIVVPQRLGAGWDPARAAARTPRALRRRAPVTSTHPALLPSCPRNPADFRLSSRKSSPARSTR